MSDRDVIRRLGSRLIAGAVLTVLAYMLSLGPACWGLSWLQWDMERPEVANAVSTAYSPLAPAIIFGPPPVRGAMMWWMGVGMPARTEFHDDWDRGVGWSNPGYTYTLWHY